MKSEEIKHRGAGTRRRNGRFQTAFYFRDEPSTEPPSQVGIILRLGIDHEEGMVTDETACSVFIEHPNFIGWIEKAEFWELLGRDDYGLYLA